MLQTVKWLFWVIVAAVVSKGKAFTTPTLAANPPTYSVPPCRSATTTTARGAQTTTSTEASSPSLTRRTLLNIGLCSGILLTLTDSVRADTGAEVRGTKVTPFNALMFQYRGSDFGGLQADQLEEPSISYQTFMEKLKSGEVEFVEFMAPDGDAAYATLKGQKGEAPIRIGEGYPIEQHDGYSSPAFAIRAVKNAGVPYKFTVPALRKFSS